MKRIFYVLLAIFIMLGFSCSEKEAESMVTIAIVSATSGDFADNGIDNVNGAMVAVKEINNSGGINGRKVETIVFDDRGDPKEAVNIAHKISINNKIMGVVGHLTSGTMKAAASIYSTHGVPVVMPVPTNPGITQQGFKNLFRIPATDSEQGPFLARLVVEKLKKSKIAIIHDKSAYGEGIASEFRKELGALSAEIITYEGVPREQRDFRTLLLRLKQLNPEVLFFGGNYTEGALLVKQMKEVGLETLFIAGDGCFGGSFIDLAGESAEGAIISFIAPDRESSQKTAEFFKTFEDEYGKVVSVAPMGYDAALTLLEAMKQSKKINRKNIIETLRSPDFQVEGVTGLIRFKENGDNINKKFFTYIVKKGKFVLFEL